MKIRTFIGNIVIAILASMISIIVYANYFEKEINELPDEGVQKQRALNLLEDSNFVNNPQVSDTFSGKALDFTKAAEKSIHAVVHVTTKYNLENSDYYSNPLYEWLFGDGYQKQPSVAFGSGVIISEDGYIITNYHVVEESDEIQVVLNDKRTFTAKLIGTDPSTDLALLKVEATNLPFIAFGNSEALKVGEWVLAVGNPFNLTSTVTAGIVSAKARNINILRGQSDYAIESYIQTDAAVNRGNSGGALVNLKGELVGINSAILSPSGAYSGYSFAIPIDLAKKVVADIIKYGEVQRAVMGVSIRDVNGEVAEKLGLDKIEGVLIEGLTEDGAAKDAGLKEGDIILDVNNVKVNSTAQLTEQIGKYRPGETVYVTIKRDNKRKQFEVLLRNMHGSTKIIKSDEFLAILGGSYKEISNSEKRRLGIDHGVEVQNVKHGALREAGIKKGFIIMRIQGEKISDTNDIKRILKTEGEGKTIEVEGIYPGMRYIYVYKVELKK